MTELPERIWACMGGPMVGMFVSGGNNGGWPEYVRADAIEALTAERDRLREAIDYILDGMGIADPDYDIDPDDDFLDAANSEWVRDTLTRLAAALKGESK